MRNLTIFFLILFSVMLFIGLSSIKAHSEPESQQDLSRTDAVQKVEESGGNQEESAIEKESEELGKKLPLWSGIPFVGILLTIALFPLVIPHIWHRHFPKITFAWSIVVAVPLLIAYGNVGFYKICHIFLIDYIPFIILLWSLFTVTGGILVRANLKATPLVNTLLIAIGTLIASWIGTTGASVLLIRPLLKVNANRTHKVHTIIIFIFLVSNIGGCLTPLGDPPLFLGFLHGVTFFWTMKLIPHFCFIAVLLLIIFFIMDSYYFKKESNPHIIQETKGSKIEVLGLYNFIFLGGVVVAVLVSGMLNLGYATILGVPIEFQSIGRDMFLIIMGLLSLYYTPKKIRKENDFSWFPIKEVAILFAGIFMTIIPVLAILRAGEEGAFAFLIKIVREPAHYFWIAGGLSSFLDNAPTYLTFFNTALGRFFPGVAEATAIKTLMVQKAIYLEAISAGAVFMGANSYIGNAPNFMVKSISEEAGVNMPSFFGYILKYSLPILIPIFILTTLIFF
jgi:Na+/H+ antiporter NhaD/arsenite permease-like protein